MVDITVNFPVAFAPPVGFFTVIVLVPFAAPVAMVIGTTIFVAVRVVYAPTFTPVPDTVTVDFLASKVVR